MKAPHRHQGGHLPPMVKEGSCGSAIGLGHHIRVRSRFTVKDVHIAGIDPMTHTGIQTHSSVVIIADASSGIERNTATKFCKIDKNIVGTTPRPSLTRAIVVRLPFVGYRSMNLMVSTTQFPTEMMPLLLLSAGIIAERIR